MAQKQKGENMTRPTITNEQRFARSKHDTWNECGRCRWWKYTDEEVSDFPIGECRRYPPTAKIDADETDKVSFVEIKTFDDHWCGEFAER